MRAITLWQPWASAIALGYKRHETRSWQTSYRGPLLIHASKRPIDEMGIRAWEKSGMDLRAYLPVARGAVVAVADLYDCYRTERGLPNEIDRALGDWTPGRFAWALRDVRALPSPVNCRGMQGLWTPDERTVELVLARDAAVASLAGKGVDHA